MNCDECGENVPDNLRLCPDCAIPKHSKASRSLASATGSEIADWIQKIFGVNRASAELAANRYLTGTMAPCLLLNGLEQAFPNSGDKV